MWRQAWREMGKAQGYYSCDDEFKVCIEEEEEFMKRKRRSKALATHPSTRFGSS